MRLAGLVFLLLAQACAAWDGARLDAPLRVDGRLVPLPVFSVFAMPGQVIEVRYDRKDDSGTLRYGDREMALGRASVTAPDTPGLSEMRIESASGDRVVLNVFTMVPGGSAGNGHLNGYRIGAYPEMPLRGLAIYRTPPGFVEVTAANLDTPVSPNFRLSRRS